EGRYHSQFRTACAGFCADRGGRGASLVSDPIHYPGPIRTAAGGSYCGEPESGGHSPEQYHPCHHQRSEEHTSELQSRENLVCRLLLEKTNCPDQHRVAL